MGDAFHVRIGDKEFGPFSAVELKTLAAQGKIKPNALIKKAGKDTWYPADSVKGLFDGTPDAPIGLSANPSAPQAANPPARQASAGSAAPDDLEVLGLADLEEIPNEAPRQETALGANFAGGGVPGMQMPAQAPIFAAPAAAGAASGEGGSWRSASTGLRIVTIAFCIYGGATALAFVSELLSETSVLMIRSTIIDRSDPVKRPYSRADIERARFEIENWRELAASRAETRRTAAKFAELGFTLFKIAHLAMLIAVLPCLVGYVFCFGVPTSFARGLAITLLIVGLIGAGLRLYFKVLPAFKWKLLGIFDHQIFAMLGGMRAPTNDKIYGLFIDLAVAAELILLAWFVVVVLKGSNRRQEAEDCMKAVWSMACFAMALGVMYVFIMFDFDGKSSWPIYLAWTIHWVVNVALGIGIFILTKSLFATWR